MSLWVLYLHSWRDCETVYIYTPIWIFTNIWMPEMAQNFDPLGPFFTYMQKWVKLTYKVSSESQKGPKN